MPLKCRLIKELEDYKSLEDDWNGYNASKPNLYSINKIEYLIEYIYSYNNDILYSSNVMISDDNDISLYWKKDNLYIEIGYSSDIDYNAYFVYIKSDSYYATLDNVEDLKSIPLNLIYKCLTH